ncbi:MAG: histidinol-phosphate transaminase [Moraxellaceae bacterium]|nr:histidinol-phosphate transaminase [Moraxellaceae bacterium]
MSCDFLALANQGVQKLSPYQTGKPIDELKRELGLDDIIKLASNENPLGCSPLAVQAIQAEMNQIGRYPDGNGFNLKYAIQQKFGFDLNRMTLGNGSNDILELVARAFIAQGQAAIYSQHAFAVYPLAVQAVGGVGIEVPAKNFGHDLDAMAAAITANTKVVFIANPNNPTGTWFGRAEFEQFMAQVPDSVLVVLDEAYVEYVTDADFINGFDYVNQYPNLLVSRTFSKAYGLASLRVGYAIASPDVTNILNRVRQPFNVNSFALAAAVASLQDEAFVGQSRALNNAGMTQLEAGLTALGLAYIPSKANFIAFDTARPCVPVFNALLQQGVIVRPVANYGLPTYLRVSIGLESENARFLAALKQVLNV